MTDAIIHVDALSKCHHMYDRPQDRLKQSILPRLQRMLGQTPKQYAREFWALKNISFDVKKGETIGIIGRNGSGKSTLLQIITGTLSPTLGQIGVKGKVAALLELGSGFNPEFTGRENVYLNGAVLGLTQQEIDQRFDAIAAFAEIGDFIEQPVKTYSSGMMVRLAFAVISQVDADVLVIDEALSVGDAYFVQKCMRFLRDYMSRGTLLFCSHDLGAVLNLCDRAIWLDGGQLEMQGDPKTVTEAYLASIYEVNQGKSLIKENTAPLAETQASNESVEYRDMRIDMINASTLRNDIEVFRFNPDSSGFGTGKAEIISVSLLDENDMPLAWVVGGENVRIKIRGRALDSILRPTVGFALRDRLGQFIFSDNTYLTYRHEKLSIDAGEELVAVFDFRMPVLPTGDYSIAAAIASGTHDEHVQHHWMHDALLLRVNASSACYGLIGVPMRRITIEINSLQKSQDVG